MKKKIIKEVGGHEVKISIKKNSKSKIITN